MAALTHERLPQRVESLSAEAAQRLHRLGERTAFGDFYLAGSAALALYLAHRTVRSLDWMTAHKRLSSPERRDLLQALLDADAATRVETARNGYLYVRMGPVPVRFFHYPYPLVEPLAAAPDGGAEVVSATDLGLMKLGAIISRGHRRDFVDLYLLCREIPLEHLLERAEGKFGHVRDFPLQALKGLADLSLVEGEPMPKLHEPLDWQTVEDWVRAEVRRLGRVRVGLNVETVDETPPAAPPTG